MMCTEVHCEDGGEDLIVYGDQGGSTEEHNKAMYGNLTKTQSEEEDEIKYNVAICTNDSVSLEKKRRSNENIHDVSQRDVLLNENTTRNSFNNEVTTVEVPTGDDNEIESQKA